MGSNLKALWAKVRAQVASLWDKDKGIVILVAAIAIFFKFRDILIDILINSAKRVEKDAKQQDSKLANQENDLKAQADALVAKASDEPNKEKPVDDDWFKK